jgi:hypothetical protein
VRIDADEAGGFTERVENGRDPGPTKRARPVVILSADGRATQRLLGRIVIE